MRGNRNFESFSTNYLINILYKIASKRKADIVNYLVVEKNHEATFKKNSGNYKAFGRRVTLIVS